MSRFYEIEYGLGGSYSGGQRREIIETPDDFDVNKAWDYAIDKSQEEFDSYGLGEYDGSYEEYEDYDEDDYAEYEKQYYWEEFESWAHYSVNHEFKARNLEELKKELETTLPRYFRAKDVEYHITKI